MAIGAPAVTVMLSTAELVLPLAPVAVIVTDVVPTEAADDAAKVRVSDTPEIESVSGFKECDTVTPAGRADVDIVTLWLPPETVATMGPPAPP